jgi:UDP-N-acetylglucosamine--N-acetylmuramyl-(pentapeptide) pyrophosphoryl-undecaprenol N-acetylglucosamine transferase
MKVLITAGGTGGHIMPAVAIAEAIRAADPDTGILFVGTDRGMEERIAGLSGLAFTALPALGIKGKSAATIMKALRVNTRAFMKALRIIEDFGPAWVIGTGGYVTGMVVLAGRLRGCTCAIQEQNTIPGLTNRLLARIAHRVFLAFPDTSGRFPGAKTRLVGNPLRRELTVMHAEGRGNRLLALGGSLGASSINRAMTGAMKILKNEGMHLDVTHQCGRQDYAWVRDTYRQLALEVDVRDFIDDMASAYRSARLAVSRCGGITLAELSCAGLPSILVPFPQATDDHQTENGMYVANHGGGWLIPDIHLTPERLAVEIRAKLADTEGLARASGNMKGLGLGAGAEAIAREILSV